MSVHIFSYLRSPQDILAFAESEAVTRGRAVCDRPHVLVQRRVLLVHLDRAAVRRRRAVVRRQQGPVVHQDVRLQHRLQHEEAGRVAAVPMAHFDPILNQIFQIFWFKNVLL